jgi:hypothetical protein
MQERQRAAVLNMRRHFVHGIGTKQYPLGAGPLQPQRRLSQDLPALSHSPLDWQASISWKSTLCSSRLASAATQTLLYPSLIRR